MQRDSKGDVIAGPDVAGVSMQKDRGQVENGQVGVFAALRQFRLIYGNTRQHFREIEAASGLGGAQAWALDLVRGQPGIRVSQLAAAMSVHQTTVSNLIGSLVRKGLLTRERTETDQRVVRLYVTDAASTLLLRTPGPIEGVLLQALRHMPADELSALNAVLQQVLVRMQIAHPESANLPLADV